MIFSRYEKSGRFIDGAFSSLKLGDQMTCKCNVTYKISFSALRQYKGSDLSSCIWALFQNYPDFVHWFLQISVEEPEEFKIVKNMQSVREKTE